ncbi:hypothetical protein GCM10027299_24030 [Larkinella ripae]
MYDRIILALTAIDQQQQVRDFYCHVDELETAFDILNSLILRGNQPIRAEVTVSGGRTELPVDVFDGQDWSAPIQQLKKEWEALLQPSGPSSQAEPSNWFVRLLAVRRQRLEHLEHSVHQMQQLIKSTQRNLRSGPYKNRLLWHYQGSLDYYQHALTQAQSAYSKVLCPADVPQSR